jgi:SWIM zinc finger
MSGSYSVQDITYNFPMQDYNRGKVYARQGRVGKITFIGTDKLTALVQGSKPNPYKIEVQIIDRGNRKELNGNCTCPLGYECKHIVAALLAGMEYFPNTTTPEIQPKLDYEVMIWLNALDEKQGEVTPDNGKILIFTIEPSREGFIVSLATVSVLKNGLLSASRKAYRIDQIESYNRGKHVHDNDITILLRHEAAEGGCSPPFFLRENHSYHGMNLRC